MRLIDADALVQRIKFLIRLRYRGIFDALNEIDAAPTIEAEPVKHERWVETKGKDTFRGYVTNYHCSQCGRYEEFKEHYCPNCGARMDGDSNG